MVDKILEKATELFMKNGFKVITMDDIACNMGISKKTIYQHYENKSVLVERSAQYVVENIMNEIDVIYSELNNPIEEFLIVRGKVSQFLTDDKNAGIQQLKKYYPEIHNKLRWKQDSKFQSCISRNIMRGIEMELYRQDLDLDFMVKIYHNSMNYIFENENFHTSKSSFLEYQSKFIEYHIRAIGTEKGIKLFNELKLKHSIHEK